MSGNKQSSGKKKESRINFKRIVISVLFGFLIILMVLSLVPYGAGGGGTGPGSEYKIAKVNGKIYDYSQTSVFAYLYNQVKENLDSQYEGQVSSDIIADVAFENSVDMLVEYAILNDFADKVGIITPDQTIVNSLASMGVYYTPPEGLVKYLKFLHSENALANNYGDIVNATGFINIAELYSYFELVNFSAQVDILYLNITNYLMEQVSDKEAESYYEDNINTFATKIYAEDMLVTNKAFARELALSILVNGWDKTILDYSDEILLSNITLSNSGGTEDRFEQALLMMDGTKISNGVYEKKAYHLLNVTGYPSLTEVSESIQEYVIYQYVEENYNELYSEHFTTMEEMIDSAVIMAQEAGDVEAISAMSGMNFVQTGYVSPINLLLPDEDGEELELPILDNPEITEFIFTENLGEISDEFEMDGYYFIIQIMYQGENPTIDEETIQSDVFQHYYFFKNGTFDYYGQRYDYGAIYGDWYAIQETNSKHKIYENGGTNQNTNEV